MQKEKGTSALDLATPQLAVVDHASKRVSSTKYAWVPISIFALAGAGRILYSDGNLIIAGTIGFLGLFLSLLFHWAATTVSYRFRLQVQLLVWFVAIFFCVAASIAFSSIAFDSPHVFRRFLLPNEPQQPLASGAPNGSPAAQPPPSSPPTIDNSHHVTNSHVSQTVNNTYVTETESKYGSYSIPASEIDSEAIIDRRIKILLGTEKAPELKLGRGFVPEYSSFENNILADSGLDVEYQQMSIMDNYKKEHDGAEPPEISTERQDLIWRAQKMAANLDVFSRVSRDPKNPYASESAAIVQGKLGRAVLEACRSVEFFGKCSYDDVNHALLDKQIHFSQFDIRGNPADFISRYAFTMQCVKEYLLVDNSRRVLFDVPIKPDVGYGYIAASAIYPESRLAQHIDLRDKLPVWEEFRAARDRFLDDVRVELGISQDRLRVTTTPELKMPPDIDSDQRKQEQWLSETYSAAARARPESTYTSLAAIAPTFCTPDKAPWYTKGKSAPRSTQ